MPSAKFEVVLVEPKIPPKHGAVLPVFCAATRIPLHLVEPLGFEITNSRLKTGRARLLGVCTGKNAQFPREFDHRA